MTTELQNVEIVLRGSTSSAPDTLSASYHVADTGNPKFRYRGEFSSLDHLDGLHDSAADAITVQAGGKLVAGAQVKIGTSTLTYVCGTPSGKAIPITPHLDSAQESGAAVQLAFDEPLSGSADGIWEVVVAAISAAEGIA